MNLINLIIVIIISILMSTWSVADNHEKEKELIEKAKEITEKIDSLNEEMPLNDPFAGESSSNNKNVHSQNSVSEEVAKDVMSLYNFKLVGLISGKDYSYISLINSDGDPYSLTIGQYLGKIKLVDLRLTEAIFEKDDKKYIIIDFNNQIRETDEY